VVGGGEVFYINVGAPPPLFITDLVARK